MWPFHVEVLDTWGDGARYLRRTLVTPGDREWALLKPRLRDTLLPLRFHVRPLRQLANLARVSVRRALRPTPR